MKRFAPLVLALFAVAVTLAMLVVPATSTIRAQTDPVVGSWRGTLKAGQATESPIAITIVRKGDGYAGFTSGMTAGSEVPLTKIVVAGNRASFESAADSKLGPVTLTGNLTAEDNTLKGAGMLSVGPQRFDVAFDLRRRQRPDVPQRQVERRVEYFVGRWTFGYLGAEVPPLSAGSRTGTVVFAKAGTTSFVAGQLDGEIAGKPYRESLSIGFDSETNTLVVVERRADGSELASLGNWQSPLAITFKTSPLVANGKMYQLRRVIAVLNESAFDVTEELSVDGGPFRRLGNAHYTKLP